MLWVWNGLKAAAEISSWVSWMPYLPSGYFVPFASMRIYRAGVMSVFQKYFLFTCALKFFSSRSGIQTLLSELVSMKMFSGKPRAAEPRMILLT